MRLIPTSLFCGLLALTPRAQAAIPTLSELADSLSNLQVRHAETTNALIETRIWLASTTGMVERLRAMVEGNRNLREAFHGGRIGQYVFSLGVHTNANGRVVARHVNVHLYGDGTAWTNGSVTATALGLDPEEEAKAKAKAFARQEEVRMAWERAHLPPELAAIRAAQRENTVTQEVFVVVEGN